VALAYRLADYAAYRKAVGSATVIDISRRTDPARIPQVWANLCEVLDHHPAPWVAQIWTKDAQGTLKAGIGILDRLLDGGTTITAQATVTGLAGSVWEPRVPPNGLAALADLGRVLGGMDHVKWRYDPVIPTVHTVARFALLARQAAAIGITRGVINFVAAPGRYKRVDRRLAPLLPGWSDGMPDYDLPWKERTARELVDVARQQGISLAVCAESVDLAAQIDGLGSAACGDHAWFEQVSGREMPRATFRGSRPGCGCARYFDVGNYGYWRRCHGCVYCYAG